jgi:hypothetical protein
MKTIPDRMTTATHFALLHLSIVEAVALSVSP